MYQAVYTGNTDTHTNTFNSNTGLFNTTCTTSLSSLTTDGLTFYNITSIARFGISSDPEFSQRELRLQFQP